MQRALRSELGEGVQVLGGVSSAEPNRSHVSQAVADALGGGFRVESRGMIDLKGKGETATPFLLPGAG